MSRDYVYLDEPDPQPGRYIGACTCAGWDGVHELACGWDADDGPAPVAPAGPIAAMPYAAVPR